MNQAESGRWEEYRYDAADNLVNIRNDSFGGEGIPADRPFTVDRRTNRILGIGPQQTFTYDGAGNTRQALKLPDGRPHYEWTWDVFNMQTQVKRNLEGGGSELWVYVYGPGDYRLWTEDYTGDEVVVDWKFRGPAGQILQEYEVLDVGATWNHVRDVIHGAEGPLAARYSDGTERYFHTDHLGTPRAITWGDGRKRSEHHYYPYGLEIQTEPPLPPDGIFFDGFERGDTSAWSHVIGKLAAEASEDELRLTSHAPELSIKYTGHERDLHRSTDYMLARSYAFLLGRFLSADPRVAIGSEWSKFSYAGSSPLLYTDPTGEISQAFVYTMLIGMEVVKAEHGECAARSLMNLFQEGSAASASQNSSRGMPDTPPGVDIFENMKTASGAPLSGKNALWFYNQVRNNGPWDFKQIDKTRYEDFGNFHYGAVGASSGFSLNVLERMAGWAQGRAGNDSTDPSFGKKGFFIFFGGSRPFGDDPKDNRQIRSGFFFAESYQQCQEDEPWWSGLIITSF